MKKPYSSQDSDATGNWRERAVRFLLKHSNALRGTIEHFVDCHWHDDASDEENLDNFEMYLSEFSQVFVY